MFEDKRQHQKKAEIITAIERKDRENQQMQLIGFTAMMLLQKLRTYCSFKSPRIVKVPNFWRKLRTALQPYYAQVFQEADEWRNGNPTVASYRNNHFISENRK